MEQLEISEGWMLVLVGALLLAGYAAHLLGGRLHVPRVTLLILLGIVIGPYSLHIVPATVSEWFSYVAHFALAMVGFLLGEAFVGRELKRAGRAILWLPATYVLAVASFVFLAVFAVERSVVTALLLAGIAPASAPAATVDVIRENNAKGPLTENLRKVVAIDDAYCLLLFSILLSVAYVFVEQQATNAEVWFGIWEIAGAALLGVVLGLPMAWLTGRLQKGEPAILEAAGFVFLCGGLATLLDVSYLLACMVLGAVVANKAKHHSRPFHAIEGASDPFLTVFFVMAGFRLELDALKSIGLLGITYVLARTAGLVLGGWLGANLGDAPPVVRKHIGWCLLPQAGVALGLGLLAAEKIPDIGQRLLPMIIATTVIFEIAGPIFTQHHLRAAGEVSEPILTN